MSINGKVFSTSRPDATAVISGYRSPSSSEKTPAKTAQARPNRPTTPYRPRLRGCDKTPHTKTRPPITPQDRATESATDEIAPKVAPSRHSLDLPPHSLNTQAPCQRYPSGTRRPPNGYGERHRTQTISHAKQCRRLRSRRGHARHW